MKYNVLLLGSGGREHALAWKIAQSPMLGEFYALPGNPGINSLAEGIDGKVSDFDLIRRTVVGKNIDMVVCGPEDPLVEGLKDFLMSCPDNTALSRKLCREDIRYLSQGCRAWHPAGNCL